MGPRWFTPSSVREALHIVRPTAERLCRVFRELERRRPGRIVPETPVPPDYYRLLLELDRALGTLRKALDEAGPWDDPGVG